MESKNCYHQNSYSRNLKTRQYQHKVRALFMGAVFILAGTTAQAVDHYTTTISVNWGSPTDVLALTPGDKVRIQSQLTTSDTTVPETIEGEDLFISVSSPGGFASVSGISDQFLYSQIDSVPVNPNGPTLLSTYINGYDGDESGTIVVTVNPVEAVQKTSDQIKHWQELAHAFEQGHLNAEAAELLCPPPPLKERCQLLEKSLAAFYATQALYYEGLAADPPDTNYTVIALAIPPTIAPVDYDPNFPNSITDAFNALFENYKQVIGLQQALLITFNRATGAMVAQDTYWQQQQTQAASLYLLQLADLVNQQPGLQTALQNAWNTAGLVAATPTASDIHAYQLNLFYNGMPVDEVQLLSQMGLTAENIDYLRRITIAQNYNQVAAIGGLPAGLTDTNLISAQQNAAGSLSNLAFSNGVPLSATQQLVGNGNVTLLNGKTLHTEFHVEVDPGVVVNSGLHGDFHLKILDTDYEVEGNAVKSAILIGNLMVIDGTYTTKSGGIGMYRVMAIDSSASAIGSNTIYITLSDGFRASGVLTDGTIRIINNK